MVVTSGDLDLVAKLLLQKLGFKEITNIMLWSRSRQGNKGSEFFLQQGRTIHSSLGIFSELLHHPLGLLIDQ